MRRILMIIPAYNESGNIRSTIEGIFSTKFPGIKMDILVVDDGSTDGTGVEAREMGVHVLSLPVNLGIGGAVQTGYLYARRNGYDLVVRMDSDGQHDPAFIEPLLAPILDGEADMTIGSRFLKPYLGYRSSVVRQIGIHFFAELISVLLHCRITDPTSGFRAVNTKGIELFAADFPSDYPEPESIVTAKRYGLRIREVPVKMYHRLSGQSSIRYLATLYYMLKVTLAILLNMIKPRKELS